MNRNGTNADSIPQFHSARDVFGQYMTVCVCACVCVAFQTEGKLYLILDFLRGGDLFTRLSKEVGLLLMVSDYFPTAPLHSKSTLSISISSFL